MAVLWGLTTREAIRRLMVLHEGWCFHDTDQFIADLTGDRERFDAAGRMKAGIWDQAEPLRRLLRERGL